ncbi:unnamed protein product [Medioppia subpectinata]|uniref:Uncharacterized protein n=1 Tax=Medioppia subpectinata TaxID=1979941 RepID=A0A7R9KG77_9ACAR|nr:unnamed protein product [Medioppia subpectinata]CAG2102003.1 unnamed protein product [Medioppia subpectinata]
MNNTDMTSNYTATVFAITNTVAYICGFITPMIIAWVVEADTHNPRHQWGYVFYMSAAINAFGGVVFVIFGSADRQEWDKETTHEVSADTGKIMTDNTNKAVIEGGDQFSSTNDQKTKPPTIPVRYMVAGLVLFCTFNLYMCRINLSTAIVVMSKYNKSSGSAGSDICATSVDKNSTKSHNSGDFDWDESTQGVILGAFFYGYLVFQVLGGRLAEIFGAKWLCAVGIGMSIVVNALTPIIARTNIYWLLLASRVVLGMFQAFIFPSCYALFSKWAPDHERSEPKDHPWISEHELNYIHSNIAANNTSVDNKDRPKRSVPWLKICTSKPVLAVYLAKFTMNWNYVLFLLKLPAYFSSVFKYPVDKGMLLFGVSAGGEIAVVADMTNNFTATVFAIGNTIAFTTGVITPLVVGYILDASDQTRRQWSYIFYMSGALNILGGLVFAIFGSAQRQDWDMDEVIETDERSITRS